MSLRTFFEIVLREKADERTMMRTKSLVRSFGLLSLSGTSFRKNQKGRERRLKATDETRALRLSLSLSL